MKKITIIMIGLMATSYMFTACSSCEVCTKASSNEVRICEKDYNSNTEYGFTIDTYKAMGYKCKASL
ncbi:MAG: hypothetical protein WCP57_09680 [Bacteroidota bacterium]